MLQTPKGSRIHIGLFGRQNAGKSSMLNALVGQQISIVSDVAGTTTDPVDKAMELLPLGPVLFIDTAGVDDVSEVGALRVERTKQVFDRCDIALLVCVAGEWGSYEQELIAEFKHRAIPYIVAVNKLDEYARSNDMPQEAAAEVVSAQAREALLGANHRKGGSGSVVTTSARTGFGIAALKHALVECVPEELINNCAIVRDVLPPHSTVMLVVPLDKAAPKGRLILPQVQVLRDLLDGGHQALVVRDAELASALNALKEPPALVITDSQVFKTVSEVLPPEIPLTGFSVLMARHKGNLKVQVEGARAIENLTEDSRVLIAEACTHHPVEQDISTVKIPNFLRAKVGPGIQIDNVRGTDFPTDLTSYDLVIHCGGCMFNRSTMLTRIQACLDAGVCVTNYGVVLAYFAGILDRAVEPLL